MAGILTESISSKAGIFANAQFQETEIITRLRWNQTFTATAQLVGFAVSTVNGYLLRETGTVTFATGTNVATWIFLTTEAILQYDTNLLVTTAPTFDANRNIRPIAGITDGTEPTFFALWTSYLARNNYSPLLSTAVTATTDHITGYTSDVSARLAGSHEGALGVVRRLTGFMTNAFSNTAGVTLNGWYHVGLQSRVNEYRHFWARTPSLLAGVGGGSIQDFHIGLDIQDLAVAASAGLGIPVPTGGNPSLSVRSLGTTTQFWHAGPGIYGAVAAVTSGVALEVRSTTQMFLPPRMTTAQRDLILPHVAGMMIFATDIPGMQQCTVAGSPGTWANM